jgi:hypothetical protein
VNRIVFSLTHTAAQQSSKHVCWRARLARSKAHVFWRARRCKMSSGAPEDMSEDMTGFGQGGINCFLFFY